MLLQIARKRAGLTQGQLAERIGLQRATYANVETARQRIPLDVVWRAAIVLGVAMSSLVPQPMTRSPTVRETGVAGGGRTTAANIVELGSYRGALAPTKRG